MTKFNFDSRETYLTFVAEWKATYRTFSETIRDLKTEIKELQKAGDSRAGHRQLQRESLRHTQTRALKLRAEAKIEAQRQYEATKAETAAA